MFLYVGTISPSKGLLYIIEAMRKLKDQGYTVSLIAAGKDRKYMWSKSSCRIRTCVFGLPVAYPLMN